MPILAAVMPGPMQPIELRELPDPPMDQGSVLLETIASEVCGTDVHLHHGRLAGVPYPIIPGHVSVGRILESRGVSEDALGAELRTGDVVTFYDVWGICGNCWHCLVARQPNRCPSRRVYGITLSANEGLLGGWAERIYLRPGVRILKLPEGLGADDLIGGGCGLFTGYAAIERSDLTMGDTVVIQGAGPVGLGAMIFARMRGADRTIMIGAPEPRLALAKSFGADDTIGLAESPEARIVRVRELTGGRGADVVIEATGHPGAIAEGLEMLRDGGTYVVAGHYTDTGDVTINPHRHTNRRHANIRGQWGTDFHHVVRAMRMAARHRDRFPLSRIIGGRYPLREAGAALAAVASASVTKAIIVPG
jgi:L-iditol 2-dehydrogenase